MKPPKSVTRLGIAVAALALFDIFLGFIFFAIGSDAGAAFPAERFTLFNTVSDSVSVEWAPNTETDLAAYRLHYAGAGGESQAWQTAATTLWVKVPLAHVWGRCRFWLTAVDQAGNESAPSDTISTILCREGPRLVGDIDGNGKVNVIDKALYWLSAGTKRGDLRFSGRADLNGDGAVNVIDKGYMQMNAGR